MSILELFEFTLKFNLAAPDTATWIYVLLALIFFVFALGWGWGKMWNREWSLGGACRITDSDSNIWGSRCLFDLQSPWDIPDGRLVPTTTPHAGPLHRRLRKVQPISAHFDLGSNRLQE